jgi:hypothetical protein
MERKFKVGDRVKDDDYGLGTVMHDDGWDYVLPYAVEFDNPTDVSVTHCKDGHGLWLSESDLTLVKPDTK